MQVPKSVHGLRATLRSLGYEDVLVGVDMSAADAKARCIEQVTWLFSESAQTTQDRVRYQRAKSYLERYPWPSEGCQDELRRASSAIAELRALLEEEQMLDPVEVEDYEEDENGDVQTITIRKR